jgi:hypothetical protein
MCASRTIVGVVDKAEVFSYADSIYSGLDVHEDSRIPDAFLAFSVGAKVVEVTQLAEKRAFADARAANDCNEHSDPGCN